MRKRNMLGLAILLVAQILILGAMAGESESALELKMRERVVEEARDKTAHEPVSGITETSEGESEVAQAPEIRRLGKHHSSDKSMAGGGVIIGGLVTAIFAAIFCYIRVTRKREDSPHSPSLH